jgi:glutaredoxin
MDENELSALKNFKKKFLHARALFIAVILIMTGANLFHLSQKILETKKQRETVPYVFVGAKFSGLDKILKDVPRVGYYTDKNLDKKAPAAQFAQAQYVLAPIVLDLNYDKHTFVLFDCSTEEKAMDKIKELGFKPLKRNPFGIILARKQ